ncbi:MAG: hypothetical protein ABI622_01930 [Chloroflexota bacterium]
MSPKARRALRLLGTSAFVALQLGLSVVGLLSERPAPFAWQMYSTVVELPSVAVEHADGSLEPIDLAARLARPRAEADYLPGVIAAICHGPDAVAVVATLPAGITRQECR